MPPQLWQSSLARRLPALLAELLRQTLLALPTGKWSACFALVQISVLLAYS